MCSIIGYFGNSTASPIIVRGLSKMEYRGYDSVGVATKSDGPILVKKGVGKVSEINDSLSLDSLPGNIGIGHTRWATHGKVTTQNAHPHCSNSGKIALVHNGIIENDISLREFLVERNFSFSSETDSEIISNLIQFHFDESHNPLESVRKTISQLEGHYSFLVMFDDGTLIAVRFHEPLIVGVGKDSSYYLSSDVLGFIEKTDKAIYPDNGNILVLNSNGLSIFDFDGKSVSKDSVIVSKEFADVYKGDYAHFTLKEISEQPTTIIRAGKDSDDAINETVHLLRNAKSIYLIGSGSSYNASLLAKSLFLKYANVKIDALLASEIEMSPELISEDSVVVMLSQSGETADILNAVHVAKQKHCKIISIVNILNSSLSQDSSVVVGLNCGPEIGVAATKSFTAQIVILLTILQLLSDSKLHIAFDFISDGISQILSNEKISDVSEKISQCSDIYVMGRGIHYPVSLESALKLKELTYIHAEGIAGGEMKHGPLALMDESTLVIMLNPSDLTYSDTLTSAKEIKARGAKIIGISDKFDETYDFWLEIPSCDEISSIVFEVVMIQLLSYHAAVLKNVDPDYPRNLAKSVTVK